MDLTNIACRFLDSVETISELGNTLDDYSNVQALLAYDVNVGTRLGVLLYTVSNNTLRIHRFVVHPDAQYSGVGKYMMRVLSAKYSGQTIKLYLLGYDTKTLAKLLMMGFEYAGRYHGTLPPSGMYPPPKPLGYVLLYVRSRTPVINHEHDHLIQYLEETCEVGTLNFTIQ